MGLLETKLKNNIMLGGLVSIISSCQAAETYSSLEIADTSESNDDLPSFTFTDEQLLWTGNYADPSVIQYEGRLLMYLNTFVDTAGYLVFSSNDGLSWEQQTDLIFPGIATGRAFVFEDGIRFYYPTTIEEQDTATPGYEDKEILSAFSSNGLSFEEEAGVRISPAEGYSAWGPTIIPLPDSMYRMFFTEGPSMDEGAIYGASSDDGLNWTRDENITIAAEETIEGIQNGKAQAMHPFAVPWQNGYLMFYGSNAQIYAAYSNDSYNWTKLNYTGIDPGFDIDGYVIDNETMRVYYGKYSDATGGEVYTGILKITIPTK